MNDTFDPGNPFGDRATPANPGSGIAQEIEMLAAEFAALGVNAHSAVPLWLGKPNRLTGVVMRSANEVLEYVKAEFAAQEKARAEGGMRSHTAQLQQRSKEPVSDHSTDAPVQAPSGPATGSRAEAIRLHKERVAAANEAWRAAIRQRALSVAQWDQYVDGLRAEYQKLKLMKP